MSIEQLQRVEKRGNSGSFAYRKHAIWHVRRKLGEAVFQCTAMSKRSGVRCKFSAMKGKNGKRSVCYWHGARGGNGNVQAPTSKRNLSNKEIQRARLYAAAEIERRRLAGELNPAAYEEFRALDISRMHPADQARLMLAIDDRLKNIGVNTNESWRETLRVLGVTRPREERVSTSTKPTSTTQELKLEEIEAQPIDRRYAARSSSQREERAENWSSPRSSTKTLSGF
jgi:hypothetical protein